MRSSIDSPNARVLIGIPTYEGQEYCLERFTASLEKLDGPVDVLFCDTSTDEDYSKRLSSIRMAGKTAETVHIVRKDTRIENIISARNEIRCRFLDGPWSHLFFLDSDILAPPDTIPRLLGLAPIATGLYLVNQDLGGKHDIVNAAYKDAGNGMASTLTKEDLEPGNPIELAACGMGCCLIERAVLEKISFRRLSGSTRGGEDVAFCIDARNLGFGIEADPRVRCAHVGRKRTLLMG